MNDFITQEINGAKGKVAADGTQTNEMFETITEEMGKRKRHAYML